MRRQIAIITGATIALAVPGIAIAASRFYRGPAGSSRNASIEITAKLSRRRPHRPIRLTRIEINNIPARCGRFAPTTAYLLYPHHIPVTNGGFSDTASFNGGRATVTLSGSFTNHNLTVSGHLHIKGALPGCASANTGAVAYSAKH